MSEIANYSELIKKVVNVKQKVFQTPYFTSIFKFPFSNGYIKWMYNQLRTLPSYGSRWVDFYKEIIRIQINPSGITIPIEWDNNLFTHATNCVYIIAEENGEILYIGKSEFPAIGCLIDKFMPKYSTQHPNGQKMNNVPEIWNDILSKGQHVNCFYCYDLTFDPELLAYYLLHQYRLEYRRLPKYNKRMPNGIFLPQVKELREIITKN